MLQKPNNSGGSYDRYLHLHGEGSLKLRQLRDEDKIEDYDIRVLDLDVSTNHVCNLLYEEDLKKVVADTERAEARSKVATQKLLLKTEFLDDHDG